MVLLSCVWLCSPPGSSVYWNSLSYYSLLQGIFLIQGSNRGLLHHRWILYHLSYQGSPQNQLHFNLKKNYFKEMSNKGFKYCFHSLQQLKIKCLHLVHLLLLCWVLSIAVCFLIFLFLFRSFTDFGFGFFVVYFVLIFQCPDFIFTQFFCFLLGRLFRWLVR